jgi:predicted nucleic acid-binding protein
MTQGTLIDTNVAIEMRDRNVTVLERVASFSGAPLLSIVSVVELQGGVWRDPPRAAARERLLAALLSHVVILDFQRPQAEAYAKIVATAGYSRRKLLDRMIAAQAMVAGATLVTLNPEDFADLPGLKVQAL